MNEDIKDWRTSNNYNNQSKDMQEKHGLIYEIGKSKEEIKIDC